jgi:hypothetical protein
MIIGYSLPKIYHVGSGAGLLDGSDKAYYHWRSMAFTVPSLMWLQG